MIREIKEVDPLQIELDVKIAIIAEKDIEIEEKKSELLNKEIEIVELKKKTKPISLSFYRSRFR